MRGFPWQWVALDRGDVSLPAGTVDLELATSDAGIAVDSILVTNDPGFVPRGRGQVPVELAASPQKLRVEAFGPQDEPAASELLKDPRPRVKLAWDAASAPQGVAHYNVYRCDREAFEAEAETLLGSPTGCVFYDGGLETGQAVYYRIRAVDAWGNLSPASAPLAATVK